MLEAKKLQLETEGVTSTTRNLIAAFGSFRDTLIATTVNGLGISTAFGFRDYDTEVISAHWTGPGEVFSHHSKLNSPNVSYNSELLPNIKAETGPGIMTELFRLLRTF
jgi:hypothetical protein